MDTHQLDADPDPCRLRPLIRIRIRPIKYQKILIFLHLKIIKINMLQKMTLLCFVWAYVSLYLCALNKSVISIFKRMIFWWLIDFYVRFPWIWLIFLPLVSGSAWSASLIRIRIREAKWCGSERIWIHITGTLRHTDHQGSTSLQNGGNNSKSLNDLWIMIFCD